MPDTNLRGSFFVAQAVACGMVQCSYGRIINIGSVTSVAGYSALGPYGASRGGIRQLTMSLADDWGSSGVTVNCLTQDGSVHSRIQSCMRMRHGWNICAIIFRRSDPASPTISMKPSSFLLRSPAVTSPARRVSSTAASLLEPPRPASRIGLALLTCSTKY